jgi:hypothetical protein
MVDPTRLLLWSVLGALALSAPGCTHMKLREVHYFAAYGANGESNFYRVRVHATTDNSETKYRSGKFPARVVDRVFGRVVDANDPEVRGDHLQRGLNDATKRYAELVASKDATPESLQDASDKYDRAVRLLQEYQARAGDDRGELQEKLIFVLSSDPSRIIAAIKTAVQAQQVSGAIVGMFQASLVKDALLAKEDLELHDKRLRDQAALLMSAQGTLDASTLKADPVSAEDAKAAAGSVATMTATLDAVLAGSTP